MNRTVETKQTEDATTQRTPHVTTVPSEDIEEFRDLDLSITEDQLDEYDDSSGEDTIEMMSYDDYL